MNENTEDAVNSMLSFLKDLRLGDEEGSQDIEWRNTQVYFNSDSEDSTDLSLEGQKKNEINDIYLEWDTEEGCEGGSEDIELQNSDEEESSGDLSFESPENSEEGFEDIKQQEKSIHDELQILYHKFAREDPEIEKFRTKKNPKTINKDVKLSLLKFFLSRTAPYHLLICYFMNKDIFMDTYFTISISHKGEISQRIKKTVDLKHLKELNISKLLGMCDKVLGYKNLLYKAPLKETASINHKGEWMLIKEIKYYSMSNVTKAYYFRNSERNVLYDLRGIKDGEDTMTKTRNDGFEETREQNIDSQQQRIENSDSDVNDSDNYESNSKNDEELNDDFEELLRLSAEMDLGLLSVESFQDVSDQTEDDDNVEVDTMQVLDDIIDKLILEGMDIPDMDEIQDMDDVEEEVPDEMDEIQDVDPEAAEVAQEIIDKIIADEEMEKMHAEALDAYKKFVVETFNALLSEEKQRIKGKSYEEMLRDWDHTLERDTRQLLKKMEEKELAKRKKGSDSSQVSKKICNQ